MATLADISVDYLVRLEQGRNRQPSDSVLGALSRALGLSDFERDYLRLLATTPPSDVDCGRPASRQVASLGGRQLLKALDDTPALVLGRGTRVLAQNQASRAILGDLADQTLVRSVFGSRRLHDRLVRWEESAAYWVSFLRTHALRDGADRDTCLLIRTLRHENADFARLWDAHRPIDTATPQEIVVHADGGATVAEHRQILPLQAPHQWLVAYTAARQPAGVAPMQHRHA